MKWIREMGKAMYGVEQEEGRIEQCREEESSRGGDESRQGNSSKGCVHGKPRDGECRKESRRQDKDRIVPYHCCSLSLPFLVNFVRIYSACSPPSQFL